jgi:hypothetical protein
LHLVRWRVLVHMSYLLQWWYKSPLYSGVQFREWVCLGQCAKVDPQLCSPHCKSLAHCAYAGLGFYNCSCNCPESSCDGLCTNSLYSVY